MYAAYACAAHNVKLLGEGAKTWGKRADLVFIRDVKSGVKQDNDFKVLKRHINCKLT